MSRAVVHRRALLHRMVALDVHDLCCVNWVDLGLRRFCDVVQPALLCFDQLVVDLDAGLALSKCAR